MKVKSVAIAISMMLAASAWADEPKADAAAVAETSAPMNMSAPADAAAPVATEPPAAAAAPAQYQKMDENLDKMRVLVGQMKDAKDPAARQQLMIEYRTAQHENMMLAQTMGMGPGMNMAGPRMGSKCDMAKMGHRECDCDHMDGMGKGPGMGMMGGVGGPGMGGMGMGPGMAMMGKNCDMDGMRGMGMMGGPGMGGMGMGPGMGKNCDMDGMRGMGMMGGMGGPGMGGMGMGPGMGMMGNMRDEAMAARMQSMEKRLDALQEMMKMMMNH